MSVESPQFRDRRPRPVVRDLDPPMPDIGLLTDYNARLLDHSTAAVVSGQPAARFAAPVIAGDLAAALLANSESGDAPLGDCAPHRAVPRALRALSRVVEQSNHP
jgi:hypothetical protein